MRRQTAVLAALVACSACFPAPRLVAPAAAAPQDCVEEPTPAPLPPERVTPVAVGGAAGSTVILGDVEGKRVAYVADALDRLVRAFDAETLAEIGWVDPGGTPAQIVMATNGTIFASLRDANEVVTIVGAGTRRTPLRVVRRAATAVEPIGLALVPDGSQVLVASGWGRTLTGLATADLAKTFEVTLGREPRAVVASDDGRRAFVSHAVGSDVDVVDLLADHKAKRASLKSSELLSEGRFPVGDFPLASAQGFSVVRSVAPAGRVFVPHAHVRPVLVRPEEVSVGYGSVEFGPTEQFNVAVLDEDTGAALQESLHTEGGTSCVLPRAAVATAAGELLVACVGTGEIQALDAAAVDPHSARIRSWTVPAGPMGIALDEKDGAGPRALVWSEFAHALTWIALSSSGSGPGGLALASASVERRLPSSPEVEAGRVLFHTADSRISEDARACASCHPEGRDDGLVWSTPDGPRNPPMLAGRLDGTAPYGWLGASSEVKDHLAKTFRRLGGKGLSPEETASLVAYLKSMPAPSPSPPAKDPSLLEEGKRLYAAPEVGCASCHGDQGDAPDMLTHNVKSWAPRDVRGAFDTPSLRFIGGTAPYFHDGRYATLGALLASTKSTMGHTTQLDAHEREALLAYLETL